MTTPSPFVHVGDVVPRTRYLAAWERTRHKEAHLLVQCVAEAMGAFLYVYAGVGSTASFILGGLAQETGFGSLFQVGFAYGIGVVLALVICAPTSGGHFNPCVTIASVFFKGFPARKAPAYIVAQILGAYISMLLIYWQYTDLIAEIEAGLLAKGLLDSVNFTPLGPAGVFGLYVMPGSNLGYVFVNEFVCDFVLGMVIWAAMDPSNFFCPPAAVPWVVGMAYATVIWGYAPVGLAANSARDVGGRLMALTIWGTKAAGGSYAAIAALTNIPAMLLAALCYEVFFTDSARVVPTAQMEFLRGHKAHEERKAGGHGTSQSLSTSSADVEAPRVQGYEAKQ